MTKTNEPSLQEVVIRVEWARDTCRERAIGQDGRGQALLTHGLSLSTHFL